MKLKVIDAFGTQRGTASVEWLPCTPAETADGPLTPDAETKLIFEPLLTVILPTKDARAPWRLEVEA